MKTQKYIENGLGVFVQVPPKSTEWRVNCDGLLAFFARLYLSAILHRNSYSRYYEKITLYRHCGKYFKQTLRTGNPCAFAASLALKRHDGKMNPSVMKTVVLKTRKGVH